MASVQTRDRRLRFSIVVTFTMAIWRELRVMTPVKKPKNAPLKKYLVRSSMMYGHYNLQSKANTPMRVNGSRLAKESQ
jgi:hypothetical protein